MLTVSTGTVDKGEDGGGGVLYPLNVHPVIFPQLKCFTPNEIRSFDKNVVHLH